MSATGPHLWLRAETKKNEKRTALTPTVAKKLMDNGFKVTVEKSTQNIFNDKDYADIGCPLVEAGSWRTAPSDAYIIGLKELPENDFTPLPHAHIMFAHCYKNQGGWKDVLGRFEKGKGLLLDLEFLQDERGRRVAAFGYYAGFAGAAIGIDVWAHQQLNPNEAYGSVTPFPHEDELIAYVKGRLDKAVAKNGSVPRVMVMGALGRCGTGAADFARRVGIPEEKIVKWDMQETARGGPFPEILDQEIFVNCIYLSKPIPSFLTKDMLTKEGRPLSVLVDVSCDTTNPHNPIPVYTETTTFDSPVVKVETGAAPLDVVAIDHLPTLLPREASESFCADLLPSLLALRDRSNARVWTDAEKLYKEKVQSMHA
ncbi:Saccharopine dehydrogenase [Borealophlyctis nickersoniae]|nr:Saccharopine dehydrogenase [Borealophlyctis nickersoniae]